MLGVDLIEGVLADLLAAVIVEELGRALEELF